MCAFLREKGRGEKKKRGGKRGEEREGEGGKGKKERKKSGGKVRRGVWGHSPQVPPWGGGGGGRP